VKPYSERFKIKERYNTHTNTQRNKTSAINTIRLCLGTPMVREEEEDQRIHGEETWKRIGIILVKAGEN
jgi:hypothetical protein